MPYTKDQSLRKYGSHESENYSVPFTQVQKTRNVLIRKFLPWANSLAFRATQKLSSNADFEEIISHAQWGLLQAADRYKTHYNVEFYKFAYHRIRGAITDGLRISLSLPRNIYRNSNIVLTSLETLPKSTEIQGETPDQIENRTEKIRLFRMLRKILAALPSKEREIIHLYYFKEKSIREIGRELKISKSWLSRLHKKILKRILKEMCLIQPGLKNERPYFVN